MKYNTPIISLVPSLLELPGERCVCPANALRGATSDRPDRLDPTPGPIYFAGAAPLICLLHFRESRLNNRARATTYYSTRTLCMLRRVRGETVVSKRYDTSNIHKV